MEHTATSWAAVEVKEKGNMVNGEPERERAGKSRGRVRIAPLFYIVVVLVLLPKGKP